MGKTCITNYLCGRSLFAIIDPDDPDNFLIDGGIGISHKPISETSIPNIWVDKNNKLIYGDCPGFGDTKGEIQDIANAFFIT